MSGVIVLEAIDLVDHTTRQVRGYAHPHQYDIGNKTVLLQMRVDYYIEARMII